MAGDLQAALGRNIRKWRQERGMSQVQLAEMLDIHRTYVGSWERGERNVTLKTLSRLAEYLGFEDPFDLLREGPEGDVAGAGDEADTDTEADLGPMANAQATAATRVAPRGGGTTRRTANNTGSTHKRAMSASKSR